MDINIGRITAVLNEHRNVGRRLVEELTGFQKLLFKKIIRQFGQKETLCAVCFSCANHRTAMCLSHGRSAWNGQKHINLFLKQ